MQQQFAILFEDFGEWIFIADDDGLAGSGSAVGRLLF